MPGQPGTGRKNDYGKLMIAVGAQPVRLNIAGDAAGLVLWANNVAGYAIFRSPLHCLRGLPLVPAWMEDGRI